MKIHVLLSIWLTKSISDTLVWYILLIDMKTMAQCFHTFRCNYLLTSSGRKTLTWTCVPCSILSHCFGYKMCCMDKQKGYMQWACTSTLLRITNQSPRLLSNFLFITGVYMNTDCSLSRGWYGGARGSLGSVLIGKRWLLSVWSAR